LTRFLRSYFHTERDALRGAFYTTVRGGHLVADQTHHIQRETLAGHELIYCLSGEGSTTISGKRHRITANALFWVNCWHPHQYVAHKSRPWELYWVRIDGPGLDALADLLKVESQPVFANIETSVIEPWFTQAFDLLETPSPSAPSRMHSTLASLVAFLYEHRFQDGSSPDDPVPGMLERPLLRMRIDYAQPLRLGDLAKLAGMSVSHFIRVFRRSMGTSPIDWLRRERINQAKHRLLESDEPVKEIARQCGYRDPYFFSKDFHKLVGMPPSLYRESERGKP